MSTGDQLEIFGRLLLAFLLGTSVGLEREFRGHEAGLRTIALTCLGAAIFGEASNIYGDSRVAAGVVQGIGFLGAGLIITRGLTIVGATTATTVWAMAGVGLLVSADAWLASILITLSIVVALEMSPLSDWVLRHGRPSAEVRRIQELANAPQDDASRET
ncbi:MAG TPA: MgtC/SapB family protein [Tepidiformaceae bacterium]|nr:MgtC/SapB family protein [Tepidiformaceae bacterium]HSE45695.1 MgtC/SapB family protein [Gemmatimonadales bacterium]